MNYTLMHKNICVADIEIDEDTGVISRIGAIYNKDHRPIGVVHTMQHKEIIGDYYDNNR